MATTVGKTDRYYPNVGWQGASYEGGFMPGIVPDQIVPKSSFYPSSIVDGTFASLPPQAVPTQVASVPLPRQRPSDPIWTAQNGVDPYPSSYTVVPPTNHAVSAATGLASPVNRVTGQIKPQGWQGLLSMLFGPSKNGLTGVPGLLGGQNAGGLLAQLFGQHKTATATPSSAPSSLTPSQAYAAANNAARAAASQSIGGSSSSGSSSGNLMGVSSSGNRYDLDTNKWV